MIVYMKNKEGETVKATMPTLEHMKAAVLWAEKSLKSRAKNPKLKYDQSYFVVTTEDCKTLCCIWGKACLDAGNEPDRGVFEQLGSEFQTLGIIESLLCDNVLHSTDSSKAIPYAKVILGMV